MIAYETENYRVLCPKHKIFSKKIIERIHSLNEQRPLKSVAVDMSYITCISADFLDMLNACRNKIILLNTPPEIFVLLNLTNCDTKVRLFTNIIDLEENRRELKNRRFFVV